MEAIEKVLHFLEAQGIAPVVCKFLLALPLGLIGLLVKKGISFYNWFQKKQANKIYQGKFPDDVVKAARYCYIRPEATLQRTKSDESVPCKDLIVHLERRVFPSFDTERFFLLLADSGMGKTSLLINLVERAARPLNWRNYRLALLPAGGNDLEKKIEAIRSKGTSDTTKTILLIDKLDEDSLAKADLENRLNQIAEWTQDFRKVIIACREQFFDSESAIPPENLVKVQGVDGGYYRYSLLRLALFGPEQVRHHIRLRYPLWQFWHLRHFLRRPVAMDMILKLPDISSRPLILKYITELLPEEHLKEYAWLLGWRWLYSKLLNRRPADAAHLQEWIGHRFEWFLNKVPQLTLTNIYKAVIQRWIDREANDLPEAARPAYKENLYHLSLTAAMLIYWEQHRTGELSVSRTSLFDAAKGLGIDIDQVGISSRSLLYRTDDGQFVFAHTSILEYFLAVASFHNANLTEQLSVESGWENYRYFMTDLAVSMHIIPFFEKLSDHGFRYKEGKYQETLPQYDKKWSLKKAMLVSSFQLEKYVDYIDFQVFLCLEALDTSTYINLLNYYAHVLHYEWNDRVARLVVFIEHRLETRRLDLRTTHRYAAILAYYGWFEDAVRVLFARLERPINASDSYFSFSFTMDMRAWVKVGGLNDFYASLLEQRYLKSERLPKDFTDLLSELTQTYQSDAVIKLFIRHHEAYALEDHWIVLVGKAYFYLGELQLAKLYFELGTHGPTSLFYGWLVRTMVALGDLTTAEQLLPQPLDEGADNAYAGFLDQLAASNQREIFGEWKARLSDRELSPDIWRSLAEACNNMGDRASAKDCYQRLIESGKHDPSDLNRLSVLYGKEDADIKALDLVIQAYTILIDKETPSEKKKDGQSVIGNIGILYTRIGDDRAAALYFDKLTIKDIRDEDLLETMAEVYIKCERFQDAFFMYCRAFAVSSKFYHQFLAVETLTKYDLSEHQNRVYQSLLACRQSGNAAEYYQRSCKLFERYSSETNFLPGGGTVFDHLPAPNHFPKPRSRYYAA
jgi:tetratricopeptide (TPR) repeat protein